MLPQIKSAIMIFILLFFISATAHSRDATKPVLAEKDSSGNTLLICWSSPPEMWDAEEALTVAIKGAPKGINHKSLIKKYTEKDQTIYVFKNGGLIKMLILNGKCASMGYHSPKYKGPDC
jgi:hypothetical protein